MAPNLPGYYYDEDKGKYFKIVPDSASVTRSKYSTTAVAEAKKQKHVCLLLDAVATAHPVLDTTVPGARP